MPSSGEHNICRRAVQVRGRQRIPGWFSFPLVLSLANTRLELVGYISHRGAAARGHYVWTRRQDFDFYEHDDAAPPRFTGRAKGGRIKSDDVYILLYSAHERHRRNRDEEIAERLAPRDNARPPDQNKSQQTASGGQCIKTTHRSVTEMETHINEPGMRTPDTAVPTVQSRGRSEQRQPLAATKRRCDARNLRK